MKKKFHGRGENTMKSIITLLALLGLISCSASKSTKDADSMSSGIELADAEEFTESALAPLEGDIIGENIDPMLTTQTAEVDPMLMGDGLEPTIQPIGGVQTYTVAKNETLMLIAFKIYGDYERWRDIAQMNADKLNGGTQVTEGMTLSYNAPATEFVWNPVGNPYLIKSGDTLGTISQDVYATVQKWRLIWDNNKPLIKDPNKIFAGFTIYTPLLDEGRDVATDVMQ